MTDLSKEEIEKIKHEVSLRIGQNIRKFREKKGLKQAELAAMTQSDRQYQYKIETGKVGISVSKLAIIAAALNVSLTSLVEMD